MKYVGYAQFTPASWTLCQLCNRFNISLTNQIFSSNAYTRTSRAGCRTIQTNTHILLRLKWRCRTIGLLVCMDCGHTIIMERKRRRRNHYSVWYVSSLERWTPSTYVSETIKLSNHWWTSFKHSCHPFSVSPCHPCLRELQCICLFLLITINCLPMKNCHIQK